MTFKFGWELMPVKPTGTKKVVGFVDREDGTGGVEEIDWPVYPITAQALQLKALRKSKGLTLRDASQILDMEAVKLSGIENGSLMFTSADGFGRAMMILEDWKP